MQNTLTIQQTIAHPKFRARFDKSGVFIECLQDQNNLPCSSSKTTRGILKAWRNLVKAVEDGTIMSHSQATNFMCDQKIRMHSWCAMD
jgi:hypothetical protein